MALDILYIFIPYDFLREKVGIRLKDKDYSMAASPRRSFGKLVRENNMNWYLEVLKKYAVFSGRARRKEFWYFFLFSSIISFVLVVIDSIIGSFSAEAGIGLLSGIYILAILIPYTAVSVRRLHDTDHSGWWVLIGLIPLIGAIMLLIFMAQDSNAGQNQYGANPKEPASPKFKNKEEYEKWKTERAKFHQEQKLEFQHINQSGKSEQSPAVIQSTDVLLNPTRKKKGKIVAIIGLSILLIALSSILIVYFKDVSPEKIFALNKKATVFIVAYDLLGKQYGQGSGFILSEDGVIVTNLHVIKDAASLQIKTYDDRILNPIGVLHIDENNDIALIKIKLKEDAEIFRVKVGDPQKLKVGEKIYAIGNPQGLESTFSEGIVSGIREAKSGAKLIQISAPISPGSSGGAVINRKGQVIGITTFLVEGGQNLNFAFPINVIKNEANANEIIYTFPNLKSDWKLVAKKQQTDTPYTDEDGYISTQEFVQYYYDPESVVSLGEGIKGLWLRDMSYSKAQATLFSDISSFREKESISEFFMFIELDCNNRLVRYKTTFYINDAKQTIVKSDFSGKNIWDTWKINSVLAKISTVVCQ